jgi:catechol 2,3-dioxygenase-like lactoylglutathione lyase family enzyme
MASPMKLAHLVLRTGAVEQMAEWYCAVLEAETVFANEFIAFITYDDEHHRLAFLNTGATQPPPPGCSGLDHVAFTYADLGDLLGTYERLDAAGVRPHWCINHGPTTSLYYRDPDENQVELQIDNFADLAELRAWFDTGAFRENPIGVEFDPAELLRQHRAGRSQRELVTPTVGASS